MLGTATTAPQRPPGTVIATDNIPSRDKIPGLCSLACTDISWRLPWKVCRHDGVWLSSLQLGLTLNEL